MNDHFQAKELIDKLFPLDDHRWRLATFRDEISGLSPTDAAKIVWSILKYGLCTRELESRIALETALFCLAKDEWPSRHRRKTHEAALELGYGLVVKLLSFISIPPERENIKSFRVPEYTIGRTLTLGERKSLASKSNRTVLDKALLDPHPMVIEKLLENPKIREADVLSIASRQPAPSDALAVIARHPRWRLNRRVATALVNNPYSPVHLGITLLPLLQTRDIKSLAKDERVHALLSEAANEILEIVALCGTP